MANVVTRPHAVFVALLFKAIQDGLQGERVTKPNEGLLAWNRLKILELARSRPPRLAVKGNTADNGVVTVPPYPPPKCTYNQDRVIHSMTAHLLAEAVTALALPAKKIRSTVRVHVFLRNHCVQAGIDTSDWKAFIQRNQNWVTELKGVQRAWNIWSIKTGKPFTFIDNRINVIQDDVLEICLDEHQWLNIGLHRQGKIPVYATVPKQASYRLVMGIICDKLGTHHVALRANGAFVANDTEYRRAKSSSQDGELNFCISWAGPAPYHMDIDSQDDPMEKPLHLVLQINDDREKFIVDKRQPVQVFRSRVADIVIQQQRYQPDYLLACDGRCMHNEGETLELAGVEDQSVITVVLRDEPGTSPTQSKAGDDENGLEAPAQEGRPQDEGNMEETHESADRRGVPTAQHMAPQRPRPQHGCQMGLRIHLRRRIL